MRIKDWDRNLKIRLFGEGMMNVLFWMFFPFMAIYFSDSFGKGMAGLLLVLSQVIAVVANLVGGYCADQYGRKRMMFVSAIGQGITFIVFALANSPWFDSPMLTFISFSILGVFGSLYWPASHAMVADVVEEKDRNTVFAVFYTALNISVVAGPILGGIFFFQHRFELLLLAALVSFGVSALIGVFIRETAPDKMQKKLVSESSTKWTSFIWDQLRDYRIIVQDKVFLLFILAGILVAQTFMQLDLLIAVYLSEAVPEQPVLSLFNFNISADGNRIFSWLISENGLLVALLTVYMTTKMSRYKERNVFIASCLIYALSMVMFGHTNHVWMLAIAMFVFTLGELMVVGIQEGFVSRLAPEHMRGQYFAAGSLRFTIGRTLAPAAIPMTALIGFQMTFYLISILAVGAALIYGVMFKLRSQQEVNQIPSEM
ncbi:MDR family MFS transporter [Pseudalkalibacillus hwajinpoensis]|uniref:MFS transporter n=1 Tax=Guptibacillus hwajinpoensis TaxID=208199 RepID=A0A4U1MEE3_9BACL|nr:MFS transporter [Pseudalkalibacillus hwajinpoensis]TKD68684.1 MFS transporter [Pseudalkalibacillus hwajinpoensis]